VSDDEEGTMGMEKAGRAEFSTMQTEVNRGNNGTGEKDRDRHLAGRTKMTGNR
jgi:hypothetical protein